jgi:Putative zinc-finger
MSCENLEHLIALDVAGDLTARETGQVQAHLAGCEPCRMLAEELSADLQWLQSAHREPADRAALRRVRASVMRQLESEQTRRNRPFGGLIALGWRWRWVVVSAAVSVLLGGVAWWVRPAGDANTTLAVDASREKQQPPANGAPGELARSADSRRPAPVATRKSERVPEPVRSVRPQREAEPVSRLARSSRTVSPTHAQAGGVDLPQRDPQIEVVTATVPPLESQQAPTEAVMLKMPTSNPDIIVYWLMDDANPAADTQRVATDNQGD